MIYTIYYNISFIVIVVVDIINIIATIIITTFTITSIIIALEGKGSREAAVSLPSRAASPGVLVLSCDIPGDRTCIVYRTLKISSVLGKSGRNWQWCVLNKCAHENN